MFHNIVCKFTKVDNLGYGQIAINKFYQGAQTETTTFFWPYIGLIVTNSNYPFKDS